MDLLDLQADPHERLAHRVGGVRTGGQAVDLGGEPGQGNTHVLYSWGQIPKARLNRTSPSTMSRMSGSP